MVMVESVRLGKSHRLTRPWDGQPCPRPSPPLTGPLSPRPATPTAGWRLATVGESNYLHSSLDLSSPDDRY